MDSRESLKEVARLRLRFQMNNRLRLESLAALSRVFREYGETVSDGLLSSLVFALPDELAGSGVPAVERDYRTVIYAGMPPAEAPPIPTGAPPKDAPPIPTGAPPKDAPPIPTGAPPKDAPPIPTGAPPKGAPPVPTGAPPKGTAQTRTGTAPKRTQRAATGSAPKGARRGTKR
jgi:hypothetical protein